MDNNIEKLLNDCSDLSEICCSLQYIYTVIITHQMTKGSRDNNIKFTCEESDKFMIEFNNIELSIKNHLQNIRSHIYSWGKD